MNTFSVHKLLVFLYEPERSIKMDEEKILPKVVVSKCLGFEACRYNGQLQKDDFISRLNNHVEFVTVCPEVSIGLSTPRNPIRIVNENGNMKLIQLKTDLDFTQNMFEFSEEFFGGLDKVDGFILKSRSPSCGIKDVKIYSSREKSANSSKGRGLFGGTAIDRYPFIAIEDEGRLKDFKIREHFLTKLFMMTRFRKIKVTQSPALLMKFHSDNKLLLMAYNQKELRILGNIVGNNDHKPIAEVFTEYEIHLSKALSKASRYTSNINVFMRAMGHFSERISHKEKEFILDTIEKYRKGLVPFSGPLYVIKSYIVRFDENSLINQTFFEPYPEELVDLRDSGKGLT